MILEEMITRQRVLQFYKDKLTENGYTYKELTWVEGQLALLNELIQKEAFNCLDGLLRKSNYRLLKCIHHGCQNLPAILANSYDWKLAKIDGNESEWLNKEALIFDTEMYTLVFSKHQLLNQHEYVNNKWQ